MQSPMSRTRRILVVDDDADFLELAKLSLEHRGFSVQIAQTAGQAVFMAVREPPDVVVMDVMMPGTDGFEALRSLRDQQETRGVPVFACTGYAYRGGVLRMHQSGFDGCFSKPADFDAIADAALHASS